MKLHKLYITEAEEAEKAEEAAPEASADTGTGTGTDTGTKIDAVADTALKAEKVDLGQAGLDALMFLISVMIHGTLSKAISQRLLRPDKGLRAANLARKRRYMKMLKAGQLRAELATAAAQSIKDVNQVANAVEEGGDVAADDPDVVKGASAIAAVMELGQKREEANKPDIEQDIKEMKQINDLADGVKKVLGTLTSDGGEVRASTPFKRWALAQAQDLEGKNKSELIEIAKAGGMEITQPQAYTDSDLRNAIIKHRLTGLISDKKGDALNFGTDNLGENDVALSSEEDKDKGVS